jgi:putative nucleotidyltransferase with HDIG domain
MKTPFSVAKFATLPSGLFFALVFAGTLALVGNIEYLLPIFSVEFGKPSPVTIRLSSSTYLRQNQLKDEFVERWFPVRFGEKIINKERFRFVESHIAAKKEVVLRRVLGTFAAAFLLAFFLSQSLRLSWPGSRRYLRSEASCYILLIIALVGTKIFLLFTYLPFTLIPLASLSATTIFFLGRRIGFMMSVVVAFMAGIMLDVDLLGFLYFLAQGLAVLPILKYYRRKKRFFMASMVITLVGLVIIPALAFLISDRGDSNTLSSWRNALIIASAGGGFLCYPMLWLLYSVFRALLGIVSQSKLNELQELQHPLLKKLQEQAPATWEHSRAIANLAEEAASKIGADSLLVRVGAYFHDIGKAAAPEFFVENYSLNGKAGGGPHQNLQPEKSAELIIDHVIEGVKILRSNGIPEGVVEFAYMHHGTGHVEFFLRKYNEIHKDVPEEERLSRSHFAYPGLKPQTPEQAILALADGVEAASRTLRDYTVDEIQKLVSHVVTVRLLNGQLDDSGLSMENLRTVLKSFVDSIHFSHHTRIKYQWQKETPPPAAEAKAKQPEKPPAEAAEKPDRAPKPAEPVTKEVEHVRDSVATPVPPTPPKDKG